MWDRPPIPPSSGQADQSVSISVPAQSGSSGSQAGNKPIRIVPVSIRPGAFSEASIPLLSGAATTSPKIEQRKIKNREEARQSRQRANENLQKALDQFHKDNHLYSARCSVPLAELPVPRRAENDLTLENIKKTLAKPCYAKLIGNINPDALARFVIHQFPATKMHRENEYAQKAQELLGAKGCSIKAVNALKKLRQNIRNNIAAESGRNHQKHLLDICAQMREKVKCLEDSQQVRLTQKTMTNVPEAAQTATHSEEVEPLPVVVPSLESPVQEMTEPKSEPAIQETVEQEVEPMDSQETTERTISELLQENSARLYPLLEKRRSYYLSNGLPYTQYVLPQELRNRLISDELKDRLSMKETWATWRFFELVSVDDSSSFSELMKQAQDDISATEQYPLGIALSDAAEGEQVLTWKRVAVSGKKAPELMAALRVPRDYEQKTLALYNSHKTRAVPVSYGKQKEYRLKPDSGVLLQPRTGRSGKSLEWTPVTEYRKGRFRQEDTNPLIRDLPRPIESADNKLSHWSREGEYFLSPEIVKDLAGKKSKTEERPAICYQAADVQKALKYAFGAGGEKTGATSLIFADRAANHMVAVRVLRKGDQALVYIHETLDPTTKVPASIREVILNAVRPFFKQSTLSFVSPGEGSQVDFSSCGVFTYKGIRAFDKRPVLDEWLWQLGGDKSGRILHQANQYDRKVKFDELSLDDCFVPLNEMHSQLLKCYQGDEQLLSYDQLREEVSHKKKLKLGQYLMAHQPFQALLNGYKANLSTTGKRYKYLMKWQEEFLNKNMPSDPDLVQRMLATGDSLTLEEYELVTRFHPIIDASHWDEANQWLQVHMPEVAKVEESDWNINCLFENFVFGKEDLSLMNAKALNEWLDKALNHPDDKHHQLMQAWCIYIKQSRTSRFRNIPVRDIRDALRAYITAQSKPVVKCDNPLRPTASGAKQPRKQKLVAMASPDQRREPGGASVAGKKRTRDEDFEMPEQIKKLKQDQKKLNKFETERKKQHKDIERERRVEERKSMKALALCLPGVPSFKGRIVDEAIAEIKRHQSREKTLAKFKETNEALEQRLEELLKESQ